MSTTEKSLEHYKAVLLDITCLAKSSLAELAAMARALLLAMESPDFYREPDQLAMVLNSMWRKAMSTGSAVECEAERLAYFTSESGAVRRSAAYAACRAALASECKVERPGPMDVAP
jgi:hypothetical protein